MNNEIYMNVSITYFGNRVECRYCEAIGDEPLHIKTIELNKARRLIWELVLAGGQREVCINSRDRSIVRVDAGIFLPI